MELLVDLNERDGTTIVAVLHDLALAAHFFPRLVLLDGGRIVADGPPREVLTPDRIREVFGVDPSSASSELCRVAAGLSARQPTVAAVVRRDRIMWPMRIADFALERYFARWEFAVEHLLCASDVQGYPMAELLALADDETRALWDGLELGYTESTGHPLLRREIAVAVRDHRTRRGPDLRRRRGGGLLPRQRAGRGR